MDVWTYDPEEARNFAVEVMERSNQNIFACYQCRRCASGCTVGEEIGFTPDRLIRMVITGNRKAALENALVWQCVSCYTCGTRCPNDIQAGRVTETLKKMSREDNLVPMSPTIAYFHDSFVTGCTRWGRVNEVQFMGSYEMKHMAKNLVSFKFGAVWKEIRQQTLLMGAMLKQRRLHLKLQTAKGRNEVRSFYKQAMEKKKKSKSAPQPR
ncbi:4Fe-4S dicluster domain-containing protein [Desulfoluna butyratoxydans]|uniref:Alpha-helical ferredoxin n=1 Tax=Desulfoluna butyratoxydans TaxID=231438 RepID=A0A4U8YMD6_9BACT|nr:4Fe-4S dicluster domain-containing protein [Desulfoluna butyratoxydans]VFQ44880.1 alpha-helical ferredoxin [Desulfoluna butyratoxydans]